jgi:phosphoglycolate phosphatase-like HAD superfamily hydrolase
VTRLILWDVDGTLTHCGTVATDVFRLATEEIVGMPPSSSITFAGKTDRQIAEEFLALVGSTDEGHVEQILDHIERSLAARSHEIVTYGSLCAGAREAIEAFATIAGVTQTVLTGNIAANARVKLAAFGIDDLLDLDVGAYGREHNDRRQLLPLAWRLQRDQRGRTFSPEETWIVGDTPRDLDCARSGGAHCMLVGSGKYSARELEGLGADAVVEDLSNTAAIISIITGTETRRAAEPITAPAADAPFG